MTERHYTIQEIDELRALVKHKYLWGVYREPPPPERLGGSPKSGDFIGFMSNVYRADELATMVEAEVRTLIFAGLTSADIHD